MIFVTNEWMPKYHTCCCIKENRLQRIWYLNISSLKDITERLVMTWLAQTCKFFQALSIGKVHEQLYTFQAEIPLLYLHYLTFHPFLFFFHYCHFPLSPLSSVSDTCSFIKAFLKMKLAICVSFIITLPWKHITFPQDSVHKSTSSHRLMIWLLLLLFTLIHATIFHFLLSFSLYSLTHAIGYPQMTLIIWYEFGFTNLLIFFCLCHKLCQLSNA